MAMANTLTGLITTIYTAMHEVARERVGASNLVYSNNALERAAKDQTIRYPVVPKPTIGDLSPSNTLPAGSTQTVAYRDMTIDKVRGAGIPWQGEEAQSLANGGILYPVLRDNIKEHIRAIANEIETDICSLYVKGSRAAGVSGTTPFGGDFSELTAALKILEDNGAPESGIGCVIDSAAKKNLLDLANLSSADAAGTDQVLRTGILIPLYGATIASSGQVQTHTKGTGTSYQLAEALSVDEWDDVAIDTGSGTVVVGDAITFAGDTNQYIVTSGVTEAGNIDLGRPGAVAAVSDDTALTIGENYTANMVFHRNAIHLVTRLPFLPPGMPDMNGVVSRTGDIAADRVTVTDPYTGIMYEISLYEEYRQNVIEVACAWGCDVVNEDFLAIMKG